MLRKISAVVALMAIVYVFFTAGAGPATAGGPCETRCDAAYAEGKAFCEKLPDAETRRECHGAAVRAHTSCLEACRKGNDCLDACKDKCTEIWEQCYDACKGDRTCKERCMRALTECLKDCEKKCK